MMPASRLVNIQGLKIAKKSEQVNNLFAILLLSVIYFKNDVIIQNCSNKS